MSTLLVIPHGAVCYLYFPSQAKRKQIESNKKRREENERKCEIVQTVSHILHWFIRNVIVYEFLTHTLFLDYEYKEAEEDQEEATAIYTDTLKPFLNFD